MPRYLLAAAPLLVSLPALAQSTATDPALPARPAAPIRTGADALLPGSLSADSPLTDEQLARRLAAYYDRQSSLYQAVADGDEARYTRLLDDLVADLHLLAQRPGILLEPRFREIYSAVLTEYERFYDRPALDRGDVYGIRTAGIDAVERGYDLGAPLLEHVTLPDLGTYATTIPMDVNLHVDRYVQFLVNRPSHVARLRERADTYFPMIERVLAEEGVPDELKYLAMVESALNPLAASHAGAAGMWQFIRATGGAYGLRADAEVDDRLDPEQATRAAARHLRDLHDRFGDWQLALAGYNCNPAVITRAARRFQERTGRRATFWDVMEAIPRETRAYVPMFIATTLVASNPDAYGLPAHAPGAAYAFDRVSVRGGTRLSEVARAMEIDEAVLRALNPSLRAGRVPETRTTHQLRVPVGFYTAHAEALERFAPRGGVQMAAETVRFGPRAVRPVAPQERGEALLVAASRQALRPRRPAEAPVARRAPVRTYNPSTPPQTLAFQARSSAAEPVAEPEVVYVAQAVPDAAPAAPPVDAAPAGDPVVSAPAEPVVEPVDEASVLVAEATERVATETTEAPVVTETADAEPVYVAQTVAPAAEPAGADAYDVEEEAAPTTSVSLVSADLLSLAQAAPAPREAAPAERPAPRPERTREATPVRTVSARATSHRVARGETLTGIARQYGLTVAQLRQWNGIEGSELHAGRSLRLTADGAPTVRNRRAATPASPAAPTRHTVRSGDNLTRIARQYNTTVAELQRLNSLRDGDIRPGQTLRLPEAPAPRRRGARG